MYLIFPDLLEESPFLKMTLPWGELSNLQLSHRSHSDDGPILWVRPGEQLIPTGEIWGNSKEEKNVSTPCTCTRVLHFTYFCMISMEYIQDELCYVCVHVHHVVICKMYIGVTCSVCGDIEYMYMYMYMW